MNDIVIIGAGIAGISAAARLSHHASVTLLESEDMLGYHASSRSAAVFIEEYGNTVVRSLNSASTAYLNTENGGVLSPRGMLVVAKADDKDLFDSEYKFFGMAEISVEDARDKIPILDPNAVRYAAFRDDIYDLDTDLLLQNFRREAQANDCHRCKRDRPFARVWPVGHYQSQSHLSCRRVGQRGGSMGRPSGRNGRHPTGGDHSFPALNGTHSRTRWHECRPMAHDG